MSSQELICLGSWSFWFDFDLIIKPCWRFPDDELESKGYSDKTESKWRIAFVLIGSIEFGLWSAYNNEWRVFKRFVCWYIDGFSSLFKFICWEYKFWIDDVDFERLRLIKFNII